MTTPGSSPNDKVLETCPSEEQLGDFIALHLSDAETLRLRQHILTCVDCQTRLEKVSNSESGLEPSRKKELVLDLPAIDRIVRGLCKDMSLEESDRITRDRTIVLEKPKDPSSIGNLQGFIVRKELASGATATVFEAVDTKTDLPCALKFIRSTDSQTLKRVEREARALAAVRHPNVISIDRVEETSDGRVFLVMPLASGRPLSDLIHEQKLESFESIVKILIQVARGLDAVHEQGMLHRDVKPSNIVVNSAGFAQLTDFGLASFVDEESSLTDTDIVLGTPAYMSPEQAQGSKSLDARSDVYSLGATLYECLTEARPFRGQPHQIIRQILNEEPVRPSIINSAVPKLLEAICLKAMEKEASSRYMTMGQMANDLQRFSVGDRILARPISTATRLTRFVKKNKLLAGAILSSVLMLLVLSIASVAAAIIFRDQNTQLRQSAVAEGRAKVAAQQSLRKSIEAADALLISVTEDTELLPRAPGSEEVSRKLLRKAQDYYKQIIASGDGSPRVLFDEARARTGLAQVSLRLGNPADVESEAKAAIDLLNSLPEAEMPTAEKATLIAKTLGFWGKSLATRGELQRAAQVMDDAVQICQTELENSPTLLESSIETSRELRFLLADSLRGRAVAENMAGELDVAEASLIEAQIIFQDLLQESPEDANLLRKSAGCESTLAVTLVRRDGYEAAKQHLQKAIELLARLEQDGQLPVRLRPDRATNRINLATIEYHLGNLAQSRELYELAEQEYQQLELLEPGVVDHKYKSVLVVLNSGKVHMALNHLDTALSENQKLLPRLDALLKIDPDSQEYLGTLGLVQGNIATFLHMLKRYEEELSMLTVSDQTLRKYAEMIEQTPDSRSAIALNQWQLCKCYLSLKRFTESANAIRDSKAITTAILAEQPDYLPSRMHEVDELIVMCDLLAAQPETKPEEFMTTVELAFAKSKLLLADFPDLAEYEVAHGALFSQLSKAHFRFERFGKAEESANQGLTHLIALNRNAGEQTVRDAFQQNYFALAKALAAQWKMERTASTAQTSTAQTSALELRLQETLDRCREYGTSDSELTSILNQLKLNPN
jgi:serine/threonine protein kinase